MTQRWEQVSIGDIIRLERRPVDVLPDEQYREIGIYCFGKGIFHKEPRTGFLVGDKKLFALQAGDLILQITFAWEGAVALVSDREEGMFGSTRYPTFRVNENRCNPMFLLNYFKTKEGLEQLIKISPGSAGRNRVLNIKRIPEIIVPLPPLAEQQSIVARIEALAGQIREAQKLRSDATAEVGALFLSTRAATFTTLKDSCPNLLLGELISMASGVGLTSSQMDDSAPFPVYGGGGKNGRYFRYLFEEPKIAIGRVGARCGCVFVTEPRSWITDNALYITRISPKLDHSYLVHALSMMDLRQQANQAAQPVVSQKKINPLAIPVPPLEQQRRIVAELDALQAQVDALKRAQAETAAELKALLPAILAKAFRGEL